MQTYLKVSRAQNLVDIIIPLHGNRLWLETCNITQRQSLCSQLHGLQPTYFNAPHIRPDRCVVVTRITTSATRAVLTPALLYTNNNLESQKLRDENWRFVFLKSSPMDGIGPMWGL